MKSRAIFAAIGAVVFGVGLSVQGSNAQERLIFNSMSPADSKNSVFFNEWAGRINSASGGKAEVVIRDGTTLANFGNVYDRVQEDVIQIGWALHGVLGGQFALSQVTTLPFLTDDNEACSVALWKLYDSGLLADEYKEVVPIALPCLSSNYVHWAKKPASFSDLSGAKIRVAGKVAGDIVKALGGAPIALRGGEMYEGLQKGTIDGATTSWSAFVPYKLWEVTTYHLEVPLGSSSSMWFMSRKKWDSLSKETKDAIGANTGLDFTGELGRFFGGQSDFGRSQSSGGDHQIVPLTDEIRAEWKAKTESVIDQWVADTPKGKEVLDAYTKIHAEVLASR